MGAFDETFDWLVVGSGAGSMASALVMRAAGKSVLILEKSAVIGGTTAKSGGVIWVPNNRFLKEDGEQDSVEAGITYLDAACADLPGSGHDKRLAYVNQAYRMIDFLVDQGVELERGSKFWPDYYDELPGGCKTSRTVVAKPFDKKELGAWAKKLRKGFLEVPAKLDDGMKLAYIRRDPALKKAMRKLVLKTIWTRLTGKHFVTAGAALQGRMLKAALATGVEFRIEAPVSELVLEGDRVTGVVATVDGAPRRIGAMMGVLVNAGGFAQNQAMRDEYMPGTKAAWSLANEGDTGDLHREMERVGGVLAQMDQMVGYQTTLSPGSEGAFITPPAQSLTGKPHAILVDQSGVRYMNEGGSYELYCETMLRRHANVPAIPSWAIFDREYVESYQVAGKWIDKKIPKGWVEAGYLHSGDTVEKLAASIGVEPAALKGTVDRWNGFVRQGRDDDFHRGERAYDEWLGDPYHGPVRALGLIEKGPFYAVPVVPGDVSTYGGVVTDIHGRVVRADGAPITGLYATGVSTASVMGGVYPGAGSSIGPSMTFGYVAAKHAAGLDNQI
ncbi:MAG TPA: FAD-dependent oxidoreductase [Sphingomonas sp.]|nr:FAD-dependent oxidoreductase [Sphingomonas sp.]